MFMESCARIIYMEVWNILQATMLLKTFYFSLNYLSNFCLFLTWNIFRLIKWENFICEYDNGTKKYSAIYVTCKGVIWKKIGSLVYFGSHGPHAQKLVFFFLIRGKGYWVKWNEISIRWKKKKKLWDISCLLESLSFESVYLLSFYFHFFESVYLLSF